jgi:hypothetical protein
VSAGIPEIDYMMQNTFKEGERHTRVYSRKKNSEVNKQWAREQRQIKFATKTTDDFLTEYPLLQTFDRCAILHILNRTFANGKIL